MLYPDLFDLMEKARWNLHSDIPWEQFERAKLSERQVHGIKMNAILEWSAMPTAEMFLRDNERGNRSVPYRMSHNPLPTTSQAERLRQADVVLDHEAGTGLH